jgi:peptide chain release factor 2
VTQGEEAGIKSATVEIAGPHANGYLKGEAGVHRLVRISPFDSSARRHTSFAKVEVLPEADEAGEVEIDEDDLRIDVFRASGHGAERTEELDRNPDYAPAYRDRRHLPERTLPTSQQGIGDEGAT